MLEALLTEDTRVIIYDRHVFMVQATAHPCSCHLYTHKMDTRSDGQPSKSQTIHKMTKCTSRHFWLLDFLRFDYFSLYQYNQ